MKQKVYDLYLSDYNQNFNTITREELIEFKSKLTSTDIQELKEMLDEELFDMPLLSVTFDRPDFMSHLDKHQYFSLSTYYWPNPDTKDGLPHIRKDGYVNPDSARWCKKAIRDASYILYLGSLMYYFTEDKKYYELIKKHMLHFFIEEETKMLPNLNYSQMIPGDPVHHNGRGTGIIDFACHFGYSFVIFKHIYDFGMVEENFYKQIQGWVREFTDWLVNSPFGQKEKTSKNNHGTVYTLVRMHLTFFTGDFEPLKEQYTKEVDMRIKPQIAQDGSMLEELLRTRPINYSTMNIKAFVDIYKFLGHDYTKNQQIKNALTFITKILNGDKKISDITVVDPETNKEVVCSQIEGVYHEHFKYYLHYIGKKFGIDVKVDPSVRVPYKYMFLK